MHGAVVLADGKVARPDNRADRAVGRVHGKERAFEDVLIRQAGVRVSETVRMRLALGLLDFIDAGGEHVLRHVLQVGIDGGENLQAATLDRIAVEDRLELTPHFAGGEAAAEIGPGPQGQRGFSRLVGVGLRDVTGLDHAIKGAIPRGPGVVDAFPGRGGVGAGDHAREQGALGEIELAGRHAEEGIGGRLRPVEALAKINAVEVIAEDLRLRVSHLDPVGQKDFEELAVIGPLHAADAVAGELLRDRAGALASAMPGQVDHEGARDAVGIDAAMQVKPAVFRCHDRLREKLRHRLIGRECNPVFVEEPAEGESLVVIKDGSLRHFLDDIDVNEACLKAVEAVKKRHGCDADDQDAGQQPGQETRPGFPAARALHAC